MIRGIRPVIHLLQLAWWKWARRELQRMNPHHPDLPYIVHRVHQLETDRA